MDNNEHKVIGVTYHLHTKKDAEPNAPRTLKVEYKTSSGIFREYICFEHKGFAKDKAIEWWKERALWNEDIKQEKRKVPDTSEQALFLANHSADLCIRIPESITVEKNGDFWNIVEYKNLN